MNSFHDVYDKSCSHFSSKIIKCKDTVDRLIGNYGVIEDTLCNMKKEKESFPSAFIDKHFSKDRYSMKRSRARRVTVSNPYLVIFACEHIVTDIECYAKLHSIESRDFRVPGDLKCSYLPLLERWQKEVGSNDAESKGSANVVKQSAMKMDVDVQNNDYNNNHNHNSGNNHNRRNNCVIQSVDRPYLSRLEINTRGKLQKVLLCNGYALNLSGVVALKYSGVWKRYEDVAFGPSTNDFVAVAGLLARMGACKIRYMFLFLFFFLLSDYFCIFGI